MLLCMSWVLLENRKGQEILYDCDEIESTNDLCEMVVDIWIRISRLFILGRHPNSDN